MLLADDFGQPNGLCFSRDERQLFVNDTERQHIRVFDVQAGRHAVEQPRSLPKRRATAPARPTA